MSDYLPPLVTQLLGDSSDLINSFAEAEAAEKAFQATTGRMGDEVAKTYRKSGRSVDDFTDLVVSRARKGESAVATLRREMKRAEDQVVKLRKQMAKHGDEGLYRDLKRVSDELTRMKNLAKTVAPELLKAGEKGGEGFLSGFVESFSAIGGYLMPILVGVAVLASPAIAALIGSAVAVGLGLGFAGIGVFLAAKLIPSVGRQFYRIGQNLKTALKGALSGSFDDELRAALRIFNTYIPQFGKQLRRIFDGLAPALQPLANALGEGITGFLAAIADAVPKLMPALLAFIDTIPTVMQAVADFLVAITANGPALSRFILDAAHAIAAFLGGAGKVIGWLEGVYLWVVKLNDKFPFIGWKGQLEGLGIAVDAVKRFFVDLWAKIVGGAKAVGSWFANLGKAIWGGLTTAAKAVADWFRTTVAWFKALPGRIVGFLAALPGRVSAVVSRMAHQAVYWVGWLVGSWFRFMAEAPGKIVAAVGQAWTWITTRFQQGVHTAIEFVRALPGKIAEYFSYLWSAVTGWVSRTWQSVTSWFARTKQSMIEHVVSGINAVISWFKGLPGRASEQAQSFKDRLFTFFKGAKNWLVDAGKDIVRGVVHGIEAMWDWAVGKIKSFAEDLWKGFKDAIGSHSPARAFIGPGADIPAGVALGVDRNAWRAVNAVNNMLGGARPAYAGPGVTPTMAAAMTGGSTGGGYGNLTVDNHIQVDGQTIVRVLTKPAQRRKARSGVTGLG